MGAAIDPVSGGGDDCATTPARSENGTATYTLPPAPAAGYTLLGAPTIVADLMLTGTPATAQVAGRLWDVAPDGASQTLVARGLSRPTGVGREVWQLHANGWHFAAGHGAKLELLGADAPYARPSNGAFQVTVNSLELRLPVRDAPGGQVLATEFCWRTPPPPEARQVFLGQVCPGMVFDTIDDWVRIYSSAGLVNVETQTGPFEMMTPRGFLADEGPAHSLAIMTRVASRRANIRKMAWLMPRMAKAVPYLGYVLVASEKPR